MSTLGDRLKALRKQRGLNQDEVGAAIGVTYSQISAIENGRSSPPETIEAISKFFKVNKEWLINGDGDAPKGVVIPIMKGPQETPWKDEAYNVLKSENQRLWRLIEKLSGAAAGTIANFNTALNKAGAGKLVQMDHKPGARLGARA